MSVDLEAKLATVEYYPSKVGKAQLVTAVSNAGFTAGEAACDYSVKKAKTAAGASCDYSSKKAKTAAAGASCATKTKKTAI